jgi:L-ascorbate metabolism protein UlaG (beta-lactamase superfamily)
MNFTYYGHACFTVEIAGKVLLFDPFITPNPLASGIEVSKIKADYILVSHGHADHVADLLSLAHQTDAVVIANAEIADWVSKQGYHKVHPMNFGNKQFDFGTVHYVPAQHSSGLPDGSYGGNPGGFVIATPDYSFYYSGDTCLTMDMQLIPYYTQLDVAILPIGGNFTMDAQEAAIASDFVKCDKVIGIHFDTFGYIVIDHAAAQEAFNAKGKNLIIPQIGQTISLS